MFVIFYYESKFHLAWADQGPLRSELKAVARWGAVPELVLAASNPVVYAVEDLLHVLVLAVRDIADEYMPEEEEMLPGAKCDQLRPLVVSFIDKLLKGFGYIMEPL
jgi:hypothetical protein